MRLVNLHQYLSTAPADDGGTPTILEGVE